MAWRDYLLLQYRHLEHLSLILPIRDMHRWLSYQYQMGEIIYMLYGKRQQA